LWLVGPVMVKIVYKTSYVAATTALLPWYAGAMVPLALANVMVNDLLARSRFGVVPWMVLLAVAYGFTLPVMLNHFPGRLEVVLQTLGAFNLLLFLVCGVVHLGREGKSEAGGWKMKVECESENRFSILHFLSSLFRIRSRQRSRCAKFIIDQPSSGRNGRNHW